MSVILLLVTYLLVFGEGLNCATTGILTNKSDFNPTSTRKYQDYSMIKTPIIRRNECRLTKLGETYTGSVQTTAKGQPCMPWINVTKNIFKDEDFSDNSIVIVLVDHMRYVSIKGRVQK